MTSPLPNISELGGRTTTLLRNPDPAQPHWSAFNPSMARGDDGRVLITFRSSNYYLHPESGATHCVGGPFIKSRLWVAEFDPERHEISDLREVRYVEPGIPGVNFQRGPEDARLFHRDGRWFFTAVLYEPPLIPYAKMGLWELDADESKATFVEVLTPPDPKRAEKNWMVPSEATEAFDFVYSSSQVFKDGNIVGEPNNLPYRGGSNLLLQEDGTYIALIHTVTVDTGRRVSRNNFTSVVTHKRDYFHMFGRYSAEGHLIQVTPAFLLRSGGVEYGSGLLEHDDKFILGFGGRDVFACVGELDKSAVYAMLQDVNG